MDAADEMIDVLREDPVMAELIDVHGVLDLEPAEDTFRRLVVSIIRQQVSMASARAIQSRLFEEFEITPEAIVAADPGALRDVGLSAAKAEYVQGIATAYLEEGYDREYFEGMTDAQVIDELTELRGVGEWTAQMFLMFCLGRPDVFPVGDLGIRNAMWTLYGEELTRAEMRSMAEAWRPYRSYASLYLWRAIE